MSAGIPVRHIEDNHNVQMYITNIPTVPADSFHGNTVVSIPYKMVTRAVTVTAQYPSVHGAPLQLMLITQFYSRIFKYKKLVKIGMLK
ncbi:MAG: DUF1445 domain-containing protein [Peptostreptococcaceae bacterium]|nr:DUF1445 domain-containing protein [Peptostreptococcaceae bacterium]